MQNFNRYNSIKITLVDCFRHGQWPIFLLSPAICFVSSIIKIRKGEIRACWAIPFVMGVFAYLFPPFADFARNEARILDMLNMPLSEVILLNGDIVVTTLEYIFLKNGIPIELFRFLYTFIVYYFYTKIFVDIVINSKLDIKKIFYVWVFLFLQIDFFAYIDNIRTIFVRLMLTYCAYQYFFNHRNKYRYYALILIPVHFAYFPIILGFFFSKFIRISVSRNLRIILIVVLFLAMLIPNNVNVLSYFSALNLGDTINNKILAYTEGEWSAGGESFNSKSLAFKIYSALSSLSGYYLLFVYCKSKYGFSIEHYSSILLFLCILTLSVPVLFGRYIGFFHLAVALFVLYGYLNGNVKQKQINIYLLLCLFKVALDVYANWNCLVNGNVFFLFLPLPIALLQTYNFAEWRLQHLADDFNKIINGGFLSR